MALKMFESCKTRLAAHALEAFRFLCHSFAGWPLLQLLLFGCGKVNHEDGEWVCKSLHKVTGFADTAEYEKD